MPNAGFEVPEGTKVLLARPAERCGGSLPGKFFGLAVYTYKTWKEAVDIAVANLEYEGKGHSCTVHPLPKKTSNMPA